MLFQFGVFSGPMEFITVLNGGIMQQQQQPHISARFKGIQLEIWDNWIVGR